MSAAWTREQARIEEARRLEIAERRDQEREQQAPPGSRRHSDLHFAH